MTRRKIIVVFIYSFIVIMPLIAFADFNKPTDDPIIDKIVAALDKWLNDRQPEKVYLQTDKPYYAAGEEIWFKAYITVGADHHLSTLSGALNVELIDAQDSVKQWIKLPMNAGTTWGDFALPDTLHEGNYRIRAYTNWMRNAGPGYYFDKVVTIGNAATNTVFTKTSYAYSIDQNNQKVRAVINYSDINGSPYNSRPVNYDIRFAGKYTAIGKSVTDDNGNITIEYDSPATGSTGSIITNIKLTENNTITKTIIVNPTAGKADVQFFPEGGNLVNGLHSNIGFKAVGANGLGIAVKGVITDNENNKITEFVAQHLGMGEFDMTPENGKAYKALVTYGDGSENSFDLPVAQNSGYVLSIDNADSASIAVSVAASNDLVNTGQVYIFAQSGGETRFAAKNIPGKTVLSTSIPKNKFPSGIVQFTLFSAAGVPLNERIAFIEHATDLLKLNIKAAKVTSAPREKVRIELDAQNSSGKPATGSFSVSVIDEGKVKTDADGETSILSQILLTSDLRGYIEQPGTYFENSNELTQFNLDLLMLTQGYRRFEWKPLLAGTIAPAVYHPEKLIKISGNVKATFGGKPVPNAKMTLFTVGNESAFIEDTLAGKQGDFAFKDLFLKDSLRFVIQARTPKDGKNVAIMMDDNGNESLPVKNSYLSAINFNTNNDVFNYLRYSRNLYNEELKAGLGKHTILLKQVTIAERRQAIVDFSSNLNGPGHADQVITSDVLDQHAGCTSIDECLQGLLSGVVFQGGHAWLSSNGSPHSLTSQSPMEIILDGVRVDDFTSIPPFDVGSVEVLKNLSYTALYGLNGNNGVLIITTKRGLSRTDADIPHTPGSIIYSPKGYYRAREFYSPQYDDPKTNKTLADLRSTIYWKPNMVTDKTGHTFFEYYNAGNAGCYRVVIEGIDVDGNLGRTVYNYDVK